MSTTVEALERQLEEARQALQASELRFRNIIEKNADGILVIDREGVVRLVNRAAEALLNRSADELVGSRFGFPTVAGQVTEIDLLHQNGETAVAEMHVTESEWEGHPVVVATLRDVTARKRAEAEIRFQAQLLEAVEQAVIATDLAGTVIYWNRFAEETYGWTVSEALGKNILELTPAQGGEERAAEIMDQLRQGKSWSGEFPVQRKDGTTFPAWVTDSPIYRDGSLVGIIGVSADITELVRIEAIRARAEDRIEHLNRVLRAIRTVNQLIAREKDRDRLIQGACDNFIETRGYHNAWIALLDEAGGLATTAEAGLGEAFSPLVGQLERGELPAWGRRALAQAEVVVSEDPPSTCADCPVAASYADRAGMTVRLEHGGKVHGLLAVSIPAHLAEDQEERALLQEVAGDIAFALHDIELEEQRRQAEADMADLARASARASEALRIATDKLKLAMRAADEGLWEWNLETDQATFDDVALGMLGYARDDLKGRMKKGSWWMEQVHPDDQADMESSFSRYLSGEAESYAVEFRLRSKDGGYTWVASTGGVISRDQEGQPKVVVGIHQDITERVRIEAIRARAEEELRQSKALLDATGRMARVGGWELDAETREVRWTEETCRIHEVPLDHKPPLQEAIDFFHPGDRERLSQAIQRALEDGEPYDMELRFITAQGNHLWTRTICEPQIENGRTVKLIGTFQDITERKRAEEALRESEARYRLHFENVSDIIYSIDRELRLIDVSPSVERALGYKPEELIGRPFQDLNLLTPESMEQAFSDTVRVLGGERIDSAVYQFIARDGTRRWGEVSGAPLVRDGQVVALVSVARDITERVRIEAIRARTEEALQESEMKFRLVTETIQDVFWMSTCGVEEMIYVSPAYETVWERSRESLYQSPRSFVEAIHPDDLDGYLDVVGRYHRRGKPYECEYRIIKKDGEIRWIHERGYPVPHSSDRGQLMTSVCTDITQRKRAEEKLRESESRYRRLIETIPYGIEEVDLEGRMVFVNDAYHRMLGYQPGELVGTYIWDHDPTPEHIERLKEYLEYIKKEQPTPEPYASQNVRKDGQVIDVHVDWNYKRDENGAVKGFISVVTDITDRARAEEERERLTAQIREQARQMEQILATVPTGVLLLDADGRVLQANPVAEGDLDALAGAEVGDRITHLGDRPLAELLTSPPRGLWHEVRVDARTFEVIARPVENGPRPEHWVLVVNDATQEREIRAQLQQQERMAAVGQLAAGIAHDFNNIMAVIVLYARMAARSQTSSERDREHMAVITQQARHATRLIRQILDFSRQAVLERQPLDLLPLLKEQVKLLKRTLPEHIETELDYERGAYTVHADPTRMQQMITNLAVNARDAMPGGGRLRIGLERITVEPGGSPVLPEMAAGEWIRLTVSDTGAGIPPEALPHIFEPFFTTKGPAGSGLGLAQVHGIVGQHGGRIDVETQVGEGTTFAIYLPALAVRPVAPPPPEVPAIPQGRGQAVLVVEDGDAVRAALVASLEQWNYRVLQAADGREALAVMEEQGKQVDLVLSDVVMPGMGGIALFHALREQGWETPMILLTGHPMSKELDALRAQGLSAGLTKPPSVERLAQAVADALRK